MHCEIDAAFGQRILNLLGEHALGANLGESDVGDLVASGLNDLQLHFVPTRAQKRRNVVGLPESQLRSAGADPQTRHQRCTPVFSLTVASSSASAFRTS